MSNPVSDRIATEGGIVLALLDDSAYGFFLEHTGDAVSVIERTMTGADAVQLTDSPKAGQRLRTIIRDANRPFPIFLASLDPGVSKLLKV